MCDHKIYNYRIWETEFKYDNPYISKNKDYFAAYLLFDRCI